MGLGREKGHVASVCAKHALRCVWACHQIASGGFEPVGRWNRLNVCNWLVQGLSLLWKAGFWVRINYLTVLGSSYYKCMEKFVDGINPIAHFYIFIIIVIISVLPLGNSAKPWSLVYNNLYLQSLCMDTVISSVLCYVSWQRFICADTYTSIRLHTYVLLRTLFP